MPNAITHEWAPVINGPSDDDQPSPAQPAESHRPGEPALPNFEGAENTRQAHTLTDLKAIRYLIDMLVARGLQPTSIYSGSIRVKLSPGGKPGTVTDVSQVEPVDLYKQFGGPVYDQLLELARKASEPG